ncbi:hypothetical protein AAFC00_003586 [Neodothiora populina]|uniref:Uncharacterized protein n=1 Tax=Neodothiora populina TaxID=2781224 RepID=A0ABR3PER1_9PEZI
MPLLEVQACVKAGAMTTANKKKTTFEAPGSASLNCFFDSCKEAPPSLDDGYDDQLNDRPRKRQRRDPDAKDDSLSTYPHQQHLHIPIARLVLNLYSPEESMHDYDDDAIDVSVVEVEPVDRVAKGRRPRNAAAVPFTSKPITISLLAPLNVAERLLLTFQTSDAVDERPFDLLRKVTSLERRAKSKNKGVAHAQTRLIRRRSPKGTVYALESTITWLDGQSAYGPLAVKGSDEEILALCFPECRHADVQDTKGWIWTPQDFYECVYSPPPNLPLPSALDRNVLETELYPFQKRAVAWMLEREKPTEAAPASSSFNQTKDVLDCDCFVSHLQGVVCSPQNLARMSEPRGGILAEEMGLGKTCEVIALITLNRRPPLPEGEPTHGDVPDRLITSRATLIVTPPTILQQWKDELNKHAPGLKVTDYTGMMASLKEKTNEDKVLHDFATSDVVLTTYPILAKEVHFAVDPPERSLRHRDTKRKRPRSPLVRMHWWRTCLDEAQMVESGVSAAAKVAALLPRDNAWAISGTPLRKDVEDLYGLLLFLRYQPFCDSPSIWRRLITRYKDDFRDIFGRVSLRHTKEKIRDELRLPPQRRIVLTLPFTAIEEQNYKTLFDDMCSDIGFMSDGSPLDGQWDPDSPGTVEAMRGWLVRLRQTCLHPQVGGRNRRALGRGTAPLRTVAEVLEVMIDQNETAVRTEARQAILSLLLKGHIIANAEDDEDRSRKALEVYEIAFKQAEEIVLESRSALAQLGGSLDLESDDGSFDDADPVKTEQHTARVRSRAGLHSSLQLQHACAFFIGTAYFQIKSNETITEPDSDDFKALEERETSFYELAKTIRKELLGEASAKAEKLMEKVEDCKGADIQPSKLSAIEGSGGIENVKIVSKAEDLADLLDAQAELIKKWGAKVIELLLKPLVDEDEGMELTGDEYEDSTKQQDTLYAYMDALRAMVADRNSCITGQSAPLVDHEMNVLIREAKEEKGHDPELLLKLLAMRGKLKQQPDDLISLRGLIYEARALETSLQWQEGSGSRASAELALLHRQMKEMNAILSDETKVLTELEKRLELFRSTMNQRLEFYRQLQYISDTVAPYKEELDETLDKKALEIAEKSQEAKARILAQLKTKQRFLHHLRDESNSSSDAERVCVICQCSFEQGVLTVCGHQYCKECIQHWWKAHRTCPVCKRRLHGADFHDITYKPREMRAQEEEHTGSDLPSPDRSEATGSRASSLYSSLYSDIGTGTLDQIKSIDLNGSYGTKIDTLARHILWLRANDAGAKSIVFSQYREFLDVLGTAFRQFGIGFSRMGHAKAIDRFKQDPSVEVFLLDAKTDSSGLNLTNAQYVFLAEPLINTAIELQAIARVHRIGQQRATTVYMYLIGDTVEEAIYDISVTRRLAHMNNKQRPKPSATASSSSHTSSRSTTPPPPPQPHQQASIPGEAAIDAANSLELQQAPLSKLLVKGKVGGEIVAQDDLWACLFGGAGKRGGGGGGNGKNNTLLSEQFQVEMGRHLRAQAAEVRRDS